MDSQTRDDYVDLIAQAVIDKLEERQKANALADFVLQRVLALQAQEAQLNLADHPSKKENTPDVNT